jgi:hypothetical protein
MSGAGSASNDPQIAQIPISMLADISYKTGPPSIRNENGQLVGFVFVDITSDDIEGYVDAASKRISEVVKFPPGYYIQWAGQFEYLRNAEQRLKIVVPFTLLIIFLLIYMNTRSAVKTAIVFLAVPFSLVGAFWLLYLLGYNLSVAVWVGLIALAGLDAETGVVMLLYLDHAWDKFRAAGRMNTMGDLQVAVIEGAVHRVRPKVMTICAILFGLLPIMWSPTTQSGADVMKRIAAPMIGGVITSGILELLIYPVIYVFWRKRHLGTKLPHPISTMATLPPMPVTNAQKKPHSSAQPRRKFILTAVILIIAFGGFFALKKFDHTTAHENASSNPPFATQKVNDLTVTFIGPKGALQKGMNDVVIEFRDANGKLVDVGNVKLDLNMNMTSMDMHSASDIGTTGTAGQYRAKIKADMAGEWTATLHYEGPRGNSSFSFTVNVNP